VRNWIRIPLDLFIIILDFIKGDRKRISSTTFPSNVLTPGLTNSLFLLLEQRSVQIITYWYSSIYRIYISFI